MKRMKTFHLCFILSGILNRSVETLKRRKKFFEIYILIYDLIKIISWIHLIMNDIFLYIITYNTSQKREKIQNRNLSLKFSIFNKRHCKRNVILSNIRNKSFIDANVLFLLEIWPIVWIYVV